MKKVLALAAAAALVSGVSAFADDVPGGATNVAGIPYSDVTADDWAYHAIADLSREGVVEGYPDGTFKGERKISRYEMAQIIVRLMAREDSLNAEQRDKLDRLIVEYKSDLQNLGFRIANLEKKIGNFHWSGDARMRYQKLGHADSENWDGRMRITARADVNDNTYFQGRMVYNMNFKSDGSDDGNILSLLTGDSDNSDYEKLYFDQLFAHHNFGERFSLRLGRLPFGMGNQGDWLYGDSRGIDGIEAAYGVNHFGAKIGFGRVQGRAGKGDDSSSTLSLFGSSSYNGTDMFYVKAHGGVSFFDLHAGYYRTAGDKQDAFTGLNIWNVGAQFNIADFRVFGE